ncbi:MAG: DUF1080 domain-containing protein [Gemmataceae bacterium]|nr:DUF1080 domain-containing protein [Gemmataceae bacterium]
MLAYRWLLTLAFVSAFPLLGHAQDKDADSRGWLKLFDERTTFGWIDEGKSLSADEGVLVLKGGVATYSIPFASFEVEGEYQTTEDWRSLGIRHNDVVHGVPLKAGKEFSRFRMKVADSKLEFSDSADRKPRPVVMQKEERTFAVDLQVNKGQTLRIRSLKLRPLGLKSIFNGKDLAGWKIFPGKKSTFEVESGVLRVKDGPGDLQTEKRYGDFVLQLECKTNGKNLNSGVFFRCRDGEYQNGYEAQIRNQFTTEPTQDYVIDEYDPKTRKLLEKKKIKSTAVDFGTGSIYRRVPARMGVARDGEWFTMTIAAHGNHLATWVDGIMVADWHDWRPFSDNARTGCRLEPGHISLQGHDPTTDLNFRDFRIAEYPK